jgi:hypothetical protein
VPLGKDTLQEVTAIISSLPEKETLTKDARTSFEYAISKKILNLYEKDPALDKEKYEQLKAACVQKLGSFDMPTVQDRMFKAGAALKTFVDGKYKIAPAESSEIRDQMNKEQAGLNPLTERLGTLAQQANAGSIEAGKEYDKVAREYNEKKNKYHVELELNARENYAVSLIKNAASDAAVDHGVIPMLYGTSHDFSDNVEKSNKSDQKKIGLISLIPKRYKGKRE